MTGEGAVEWIDEHLMYDSDDYEWPNDDGDYIEGQLKHFYDGVEGTWEDKYGHKHSNKTPQLEGFINSSKGIDVYKGASTGLQEAVEASNKKYLSEMEEAITAARTETRLDDVRKKIDERNRDKDTRYRDLPKVNQILIDKEREFKRETIKEEREAKVVEQQRKAEAAAEKKEKARLEAATAESRAEARRKETEARRAEREAEKAQAEASDAISRAKYVDYLDRLRNAESFVQANNLKLRIENDDGLLPRDKTRLAESANAKIEDIQTPQAEEV